MQNWQNSQGRIMQSTERATMKSASCLRIGSWKKTGWGVFVLLIGLLVFSLPISAQEFRGTISGTVKDPTGAVIPGATVQAREVSTGTLNQTVSGSSGQYVIPYLLPGQYSITVEASGFEKITRNGITVDSSAHPIVDLTLQIGNANQTVTVTDEAPLLDTANAAVNTVISTSSVADLPLNGRTPAALAELSAGVITTSAPEQVHPFDNNAGNAWSIGGTPNQVSEVLLDGSPDETLLGALAFSPSQDSVQEVSVQPFATDASLGHTIGGVINQVTKSGTNRLHGTAYEFGQISGIDANLYFNSAPWNKGTAKPDPTFHFNQYGLTVGGPIIAPKLYNGKDKLFFFFAWEGLKDSTPASTILTVPTTSGGLNGKGEAGGDFYQLLAAGCSSGTVDKYVSNVAECYSSSTGKYTVDPYQLYDPRSGVNTGGTITRTPIYQNQLGNATASSTSTIGAAIVKLFPAPNATGTATGTSNYNSNAPSIDNYNNEFGRIDYNLSTKDHVFFDFRHNIRGQVKNNYFGNNTTGTTLTRENWGATLDNIYTLNPTTFFDVRLNWMLFKEAHGTPAQAYGPASVGMPSSLATSSTEVQLPYINFSAGGTCGSASYECLGDNSSSIDPSTNYQVFADVTKITGKHTLKAGFDGRQYRLSVTSFGDSSSGFAFSTSWTNAGTGGVSSGIGYDLAALELGVPSSGEYDINARADYHQYYIGSFVQDDWRVNDKFTLNLGLRFDINTPFEERLGKTVSGWNPTATVNYSKAVVYTSTPQTVNGQTFSVASINTNGGLTFPNQNNGAVFATNNGFLSPRIGFSYSVDPKMVVRGGFGIFVQPETMSNMNSSGTTSSNALSNQEGFSASTGYTTSNDGVTVVGSMANPFPNGFTAATGSSLGASTFLGSPAAISFLAPSQHDPYSERWNLGVQRQITSHLFAEAMYVGNHSLHLPIGTQNINAVQKQYLSTTPYFNYNLNTAYGNTISSNPFNGALGTGNTVSLNTATKTSLGSFVVPYPQYGTTAITEQNQTIGQSYFHSGILHVEERAMHGLTLTANYSFAKMIEADSFLNDQDTTPTHRISPFDHTHHFTAGGTYELPFGKGKLFSLGGKRLWDEIAGGFVINGIYQFQSGAPITFTADIPLDPSITSYRQIYNHPRQVSAAALDTAAFITTATPKTCTGTCDGSVNIGGQYVDHYRTLPQTLSWVRQDGYNNMDASILKDIHFTEGTYFQLRFETFNTLNHPIFAAPAVSSATSSSFGTITAVASSSSPRQIQIGGRIVF